MESQPINPLIHFGINHVPTLGCECSFCAKIWTDAPIKWNGKLRHFPVITPFGEKFFDALLKWQAWHKKQEIAKWEKRRMEESGDPKKSRPRRS